MYQEPVLATYDDIADVVAAGLLVEPLVSQATLLLEACNDWPSIEVKNPIDLLRQLHHEVSGSLTYEALANYCSGLTGSPWIAASLAGLLELFRRGPEFDKTSNLADLMLEVTIAVRGAKEGYSAAAAANLPSGGAADLVRVLWTLQPNRWSN